MCHWFGFIISISENSINLWFGGIAGMLMLICFFVSNLFLQITQNSTQRRSAIYLFIAVAMVLTMTAHSLWTFSLFWIAFTHGTDFHTCRYLYIYTKVKVTYPCKVTYLGAAWVLTPPYYLNNKDSVYTCISHFFRCSSMKATKMMTTPHWLIIYRNHWSMGSEAFISHL